MKNKKTIEEVMSDTIISSEMMEQLLKNNSSSRIPFLNSKQIEKEQSEANHEHWKKSAGDRLSIIQQQPNLLLATRTTETTKLVKDNFDRIEYCSPAIAYRGHMDGDEFKTITFDHISTPSCKHAKHYYRFIKIIVAITNSAGAVMSSNQTLTVGFSFREWLDFNRLITTRSKFLKEIKRDNDGSLLYVFNIKIYDCHELKLGKSLSNYSDVFTHWYLRFCDKENIDELDIEAAVNLATKLFDEEWCSIDHLY